MDKNTPDKPELYRRAITMMVSGSSPGEIAKELGVSRSTVVQWFSGGNKVVGSMLYKTVVDTLLSEHGPAALKAVGEVFGDSKLPSIMRGEFALRFFETVARMNTIFTKGKIKGDGDGDAGGTVVIQQFITAAPELAARARQLRTKIIDTVETGHKRADETDGSAQRP